MKPDLEADLEQRIRSGRYRSPREAIRAMLNEGLIASPKQAWRTLEKWDGKGKYEYGVSLDMGWMLPMEARPAGEDLCEVLEAFGRHA